MKFSISLNRRVFVMCLLLTMLLLFCRCCCFNRKVFIYFFYFSMNTYLWYSLEAPHLGASIEYPQRMFLWRNKKKTYVNTLSYLKRCMWNCVRWRDWVFFLLLFVVVLFVVVVVFCCCFFIFCVCNLWLLKIKVCALISLGHRLYRKSCRYFLKLTDKKKNWKISNFSCFISLSFVSFIL